MATTTNKLIPRNISRMAAFTPSLEGVDVEARTVTFSLSSEEANEDWPGEKLILDHSPESVDMTRMMRGAPLLFNHDRDKHIGRIIAAEIVDRKLRVTAKFSNSERGKEKFQDVADGILAEASVSASLQNVVLESTSDEGDTYRATRWTPLEASLVTVPADITVGVGRSAKPNTDECIQISNTMSEENKQPEKAPETVERAATEAKPVIEFRSDPKAVERASKDERQRVSEIHRLANAYSVKEEIVRDYVDNAKPLAEFQHMLLTERHKAKPVETPSELGMSKKEKKEYSIVRALRALATPGGSLAGTLEGEASDAMAKNLKRQAKGFFIPTDMTGFDDARVTRALAAQGRISRDALQAGSAPLGGYTVATDVRGSSMIELLRNRMVMSQVGVTQLSGLVGNVAIPKQDGGATAYWLGEDEEVTESNLSFGNVVLTPKRLAALTAVTKQLLAQSSIDVEALMRDDLMRVLALAKDKAALHGSGVDGQPLGIFNTDGVNTVTFGGAPTFAKIVDFQTAIAEDNADIGSMAYVTSAPVAGKLKTTSKDTGSGKYLWNGRLDQGELDGYTGRATQQIEGNKVLFGAFGNAISADWDGIDVTVDPYTLAASGKIRVVVNLMTDFALRHKESFCISTDAGNQ